MSATLRVAVHSNTAFVQVSGRASFQNSEDLKSFCTSALDNSEIKTISINMSACEGMDSTFMGILTMISLTARQKSTPVEMVNTTDYCLELLTQLGLKPMFDFVEKDEEVETLEILDDSQDMTQEQHSVNVLKAHETLIEVNEDNRSEFQDIVNFLKADQSK